MYSFCAGRHQMTCGPVSVRGPGVGYPWCRGFQNCLSLSWLRTLFFKLTCLGFVRFAHENKCQLSCFCVNVSSNAVCVFTFRVMREDKKVHTGSAGSRAKDGDSLRVASKVADIFIEPAQRLDLIQQTVVPLGRLVPCAQKACKVN